jgi:hypothetical protein
MPSRHLLAAPLALAALLFPPVAFAQDAPDDPCPDERMGREAAVPGAPGLRFGLTTSADYGVTDQQNPNPLEDLPRVARVLTDLRPASGPLLLHQYRSYVPDARTLREDDVKMRRRLDFAARQGTQYDYVLAYRTQDDAAGFARWVADIVRRYGTHPGLESLQIANEVNVFVNPGLSDGSFAGAYDALVQGMLAADRARDRLRGRRPRLGFNYFYRLPRDAQFFRHLRDRAGQRFREAIDYIGLDTYPQIFAEPENGVAAHIRRALGTLRCYATWAGISRRVPMRVNENGWTSAGRDGSEQRQAREIARMIRTTHRFRGTYNVTHHILFGLSDARSTDGNDGTSGLVRRDFSRKPAYATYRRLIRELRGPRR